MDDEEAKNSDEILGPGQDNEGSLREANENQESLSTSEDKASETEFVDNLRRIVEQPQQLMALSMRHDLFTANPLADHTHDEHPLASPMAGHDGVDATATSLHAKQSVRSEVEHSFNNSILGFVRSEDGTEGREHDKDSPARLPTINHLLCDMQGERVRPKPPTTTDSLALDHELFSSVAAATALDSERSTSSHTVQAPAPSKTTTPDSFCDAKTAYDSEHEDADAAQAAQHSNSSFFSTKHDLFAPAPQNRHEHDAAATANVNPHESMQYSDRRHWSDDSDQRQDMENVDDEVQVLGVKPPSVSTASTQQRSEQVMDEVDPLVCLEEINNMDDGIRWMGAKPSYGWINAKISDRSQGDEQLQVSDHFVETTNEIAIAPTQNALNCEDPDPSESFKELRRSRRRRLRRMAKRSNPSFVAMLEVNYDVSDDDEIIEDEIPQLELEQLPKRIRIDLDAELGLKDAKPTLFIKQENDSTQYKQDLPSSDIHGSGRGALEVSPKYPHETTPADEGWYEGTAPVHLPEDAEHLAKTQQWVRQNIELFSTTESDIASASAGRRITPVRGRVGLRCIHCAKAVVENIHARIGNSSSYNSSEATRNKLWPPGAVIYPVSIASIQSLCSQKMQSHLEECPNLSAISKMHFLSLKESAESTNQQRTPRRSEGGLVNAIYYVISARRIGLVDAKDGIRFGRDLDLEPLPFATVRSQVENESTSLNATTAGNMDSERNLAEPRITADAESEAVLAEAVAETDDQPGSMALCRVEDKCLLTDYMFLVIRQMIICHAGPIDFVTRGKKTKSLRIGLAGFGCRWCQGGDVPPDWSTTDFSCRSFASASDNLSSSISNSFATHLQKCYKVPGRIKKALSAYKRIHQRQMAQLSYGSQRKHFRELWARLRAVDRSEEDISSDTKGSPSDLLNRPSSLPSARMQLSAESEVDNVAMQQMSEDETQLRLPTFPVCEDWETKAVLHEAVTDWDPTNNDNLILPSDRHLVSDYVFLVMRQLRIVSSDKFDAQRSRRHFGGSGLPGLACIHCMNQGPADASPSGRSFPSAPDNFASALNSSMYNHMQACAYVPELLKRALANTRRIHSAQCVSIKFGSQRRYFNLLFDRLNRAARSPEGKEVSTTQSGNTATTESFLSQFGFIEVPTKDIMKAIFICQHCRMVPIQFRSRDSTFIGKPPVDFVQQHSLLCKKSSLNLEIVAEALENVLQSTFGNDLSILDRDTFKAMIRSAVGNNATLGAVLTDDVKRVLYQQRTGGSEDTNCDQSKDLWNTFPCSVSFSSVESAFRSLACEVGDMSLHLKDHPVLIQYLLLISPSFVVSDNE